MTLIGILHWHGKIRNQFHFTGQKDTTSSLILIHCHSLFLSSSFRSEAMEEDVTVKYWMAQNSAHHPHALCDKSPGFKAISCIQTTKHYILALTLTHSCIHIKHLIGLCSQLLDKRNILPSSHTHSEFIYSLLSVQECLYSLFPSTLQLLIHLLSWEIYLIDTQRTQLHRTLEVLQCDFAQIFQVIPESPRPCDSSRTNCVALQKHSLPVSPYQRNNLILSVFILN